MGRSGDDEPDGDEPYGDEPHEGGEPHDGHDDGDDPFDDESMDPDAFDDEYREGPYDPLDAREAAMVEQDLTDLADFEAAFSAEGYRGVAVWCHDCAEEHYYPWDMLRENLQMLLDTGEAPVHEPAFAPEPSRYVPWDYARGYVDALRDTGVTDRHPVDACVRCGLELTDQLAQANFCPRCGSPMFHQRIADVLSQAGLDDEKIAEVLAAVGLPVGHVRGGG